MVHLPALPGAPGYGGRREAIRAAALGDARALAEAGFDGLLVENFGDVPVLVGSGVTPDNAAVLLELADGAIVGTAVKRDGVTANPKLAGSDWRGQRAGASYDVLSSPSSSSAPSPPELLRSAVIR